jgi:hypothetical protein
MPFCLAIPRTSYQQVQHLMHPTKFLPVVAAVMVSLAIAERASSATPADAVDEFKSQSTVVFADDFDRSTVGDMWTGNDGRARRTSGLSDSDFQPQASIDAGVLTIKRTAGSDHAATLKTNVAFTDAVIELRFRLTDRKGFGVNINDPGLAETVHAGHVCRVAVNGKAIQLVDQKTGVMDLKYRQLRDVGAEPAKLESMVKGKSDSHPISIRPDHWHTLSIVIMGDQISASVDGAPAGVLRSEGIAHASKVNIALTVDGVADFDNAKVWKIH